MTRAFNIFILSFFLLSFTIMSALAQESTGRKEREILQHAKNLANFCLTEKGWTAIECLKATAYSNRTLVTNYYEALKERQKSQAAEMVKLHCAASTVIGDEQAPETAIGSALAECANQISDTTATTNIQPELSLYQLLIAATLCIQKDPRCAATENSLSQYNKLN